MDLLPQLLPLVTSFRVEDVRLDDDAHIDDWAWKKGQRYGTIVTDLGFA